MVVKAAWVLLVQLVLLVWMALLLLVVEAAVEAAVEALEVEALLPQLLQSANLLLAER